LAKGGDLPWCRAEEKNNLESQQKASKKIREETSLEELCEGLPPCFLEYMKYVRSLKFESKPNYTYCKNLFDECFFEQKFKVDNVWDWHIQK
jgi:casein kinase I homolog HRR25